MIPLPKSLIHRLCLELSALEEPRDYYRGSGGPPEGKLPGEVICFARQNASVLEGGAERSHHHRHVCIVALKGEGSVRVDVEKIRLTPGQALVIQPYQYHSYTELERKLRWLFVTFDGEGWRELANAAYEIGELEGRLLLELLGLWREERSGALGWHLGLFLQRLLMQGVPGKPGKLREEEEADLLTRVNRYALTRLDEAIALPDLARAMAMSESHLRARFRQLAGVSLGAHLRGIRLNRACALLHETREPVTRVAERCGFDSVYSFSRAFKAAFGVSPRDYRRLGYG